MRTSSHRHRLTTTAAIIALSCGLGGAGGGLDGRGQDVTLETVLGRAAVYVEDYQRILGSVIAEEDYVQEYGDVSRRTVSDLLLFSSPEPSQPWLAFRDVLTVDGAPVEDRQARLAELLRNSPEVSAERWERLVEESARFNIGPIFRNVNAPTMALQLLTAADQPRSSFTARGEQDVGGVAAWIVDFQERDAPALIQGQRRQDLFAHGTFWIDPESGRVVQTELRTIDQTLIPLGAQGAVPAELTTQAVVSYAADPELDLWVPARMTETYRLEEVLFSRRPGWKRKIEIRCEATYSNFRRFEVDVSFAIPPASQP